MTQIALELGISVSKLCGLIKRYRTLANQFNYYRERAKQNKKAAQWPPVQHFNYNKGADHCGLNPEH